MTTMEYCIPGPLRILSSWGTTQYFNPASVGEEVNVMVEVIVGGEGCACVGMGSAVWVGVAIPVAGRLHAASRTIHMLERKSFFISHTLS